MFKNYHVRPFWDMTLAQVGTVEILVNGVLTELVSVGVKDTTGAPVATAGKFIRGAIIQNAVTGINYQNTGTTASPVWSVIDVSSGGLPALTNGRVWVGNGSNVATAVALSGDITITNAGVAAIGADKVLKTMLASGVRATFMDMFLDDSYTTVGGAAAEVIAVVGALPTDKVIVSLYDNGTANVSIVSAVAGTDQITVTFSADPGNDTVIAYVVKRATA